MNILFKSLKKMIGIILKAVIFVSILAATDNSVLAGPLIAIDGSSTVYPITEAVAEEFRNVDQSVRVTVGISGTGGGFKKFCRGETDISDASRPIKAEEIKLCAENGIEFIELPVAYDGLAVVVNPQNNWADTISVEELKKIWEPSAQGNIKKWSQIRSNWPQHEIHLFGPGVDSGTFDYFTEAIVGKSQASRGDFTSSEDDNVLVQGVAMDKYSLGYFGLAYYEENKDKLKVAKVDNGKAAVAPSAKTVENGSYTPLSRPLFIYINKKSLDKPEVNKFIDFYLQDGSALAREVGYISLPTELLDLVRKKFRERIVGSIYDGNPSVSKSLKDLLK